MLDQIWVIAYQSSCLQYNAILISYYLLSVTVRFTQEIYTVSEAVASQNLALYVCVFASTVERNFSVTLYPVSGTAAGRDVLHVMMIISSMILKFIFDLF